MDRLLTVAEMRAADKYTIENLKVPSGELMRRAGRALAEEISRLPNSKVAHILFVCGNGNNGGDGYVAAEILRAEGYDVSVFAFGGDLSHDCAREKARYFGEYTEEISGDIIVDCIFGTGLTREVSGRFAEDIKKINSSGAFVVSADIPSGLDGDNGKALGCAVRANLTVAIAELKVGFYLGDAMDFCGKTVRRDIGITCPDDNYIALYGDVDVAKFFPKRRRNSHKGTYGSACLAVGSKKYTGAAALAVSAALQSGCGYVKVASENEVKNLLVLKYPQAIYCEKADLNCTAIAIGSGRGVSEELYAQICELLHCYGGKLIIDADGLNALSKYGAKALKGAKCGVLLTPHYKEFSRLTQLGVDEIESNPVELCKKFAAEYNVCVLLKGACSVISDGRRTVVNARGTTALSKGGSGDILTGFICGTAARGLNLFDSAVASAYVLGVSAEISSEEKTDYCATARDIIKNLPFAVRRLTDLL